MQSLTHAKEFAETVHKTDQFYILFKRILTLIVLFLDNPILKKIAVVFPYFEVALAGLDFIATLALLALDEDKPLATRMLKAIALSFVFVVSLILLVFEFAYASYVCAAATALTRLWDFAVAIYERLTTTNTNENKINQLDGKIVEGGHKLFLSAWAFTGIALLASPAMIAGVIVLAALTAYVILDAFKISPYHLLLKATNAFKVSTEYELQEKNKFNTKQAIKSIGNEKIFKEQTVNNKTIAHSENNAVTKTSPRTLKKAGSDALAPVMFSRLGSKISKRFKNYIPDVKKERVVTSM